MKTAFYFIFTVFTSTSQLITANPMNSTHYYKYIIAAVIWILFLWHISSKGAKSQA